MDHPDSPLSRFAYLMVVQRGDVDRFRFLSAAFRERPVEVLWDRRVGDRRRSNDANDGTERRAGDRRQRPPASWENLGFLVARRELDKERK